MNLLSSGIKVVYGTVNMVADVKASDVDGIVTVRYVKL